MNGCTPTLHLLTAVVALMTAMQSIQSAWGAAQSDDRRNGAYWYQRAYDRYLSLAPSAAQWNAVVEFEVDPSAPAPSDLRQYLYRLQPALNLARRAAHQSSVEFQTDVSDGLLMKHEPLVQMRTLARALHYDVLLRLQDDDHFGAVDRLATMYRFASQAPQEGTFAGSAVANALLHYAEDHLQRALDHAAIGQEEAAILLRALNRFDAVDPLAIRSTIVDEHARTTQWMQERYAGENGVESLRADAEHLAMGDERAIAAIKQIEPEQLEQELERADRFMLRVVDAYSSPDPEQARATLDLLRQELNEGEHGVLARELLGMYVQYHGTMFEAKDLLRRRASMLRNIADGTADPMDLANAAVWYMRAVNAIGSFDPVKFERIRAYAAEHTMAADDELTRILTDWELQQIIDTLRQASQIRRCDFTPFHGQWPATLRRYHPGLRDAARLLTADAARLIHASGDENYAAAVDRCAVAYRMCAHLGGDESMLSAMVAHTSFRDVDALATAAIDANYFNHEARTTLARAARIRMSDPFGYRASIDASRSHVQRYLSFLAGEVTAETLQQQRAFMEQCSPERLLWVMVVLDQSEDFRGRETRQADEHLRHLDDVINAEAFRDSMAQADYVRSLAEKASYLMLADIDPPLIAPVSQLRDEAPRDVRTAHAKFRQQRATPEAGGTNRMPTE